MNYDYLWICANLIPLHNGLGENNPCYNYLKSNDMHCIAAPVESGKRDNGYYIRRSGGGRIRGSLREAC